MSLSPLQLNCTIQYHQQTIYVDTPTTLTSSWDAPNIVYDVDNPDNDIAILFSISSLGTADTGTYVCSARLEDNSGDQYIITSPLDTDSLSFEISELQITCAGFID